MWNRRARLWTVHIIFSALPDFHDVASWRRRVRLLMAGCLRGSTNADIQQQLRNQGCARGTRAQQAADTVARWIAA